MILANTVFHLYKGYSISGLVPILIVFHLFLILIISIYLERKYTNKYQSLFYREELFNSLCSNINDVFIIFRIDKMEYEYISPNIDRVLGINSKTFQDSPLKIFEYTDPSNAPKLESLFTTDILNNYYETECEFRNKITSQLIWVAIRIFPVMYNQKVLRYICCISDLTKVKESQQILKNAFTNSQKANEAKKEFLSHMSHELRTPINAIIGMAQIASNSLEDKEKVLGCLDKISCSSQNLLKIINNILDMAKIDSDKLKLSYAEFNLKDFLKNYVSIARTQADINHQDFDLILTDITNEQLIGDSLKLEQILNNCVSNAVKFTQNGGKIKLEVSELESHANKALFRFNIIDNGKGISEDFINRLFIPFEQEDASIARKYGGSGLGMSITKNLVTLMGGNIKVASKLGEGTTITIDIVFEISNSSNIDALPKEEKTIDYDFSGYRILVVEDNEINLEITCELLKYVKVTIETASDGYEAIKLFTASQSSYYDLILMDVQMPGLNGYETAKALRNSSHPDAYKIPIIAMSADTYVDDISLNLESGMNYHIAKPIDINDFYSMLQKVFTKEEAYPDLSCK